MSAASVRAMAAKRRKRKRQKEAPISRSLNEFDDEETFDTITNNLASIAIDDSVVVVDARCSKLHKLMSAAIMEMNQSDYWNEAKRSILKSREKEKLFPTIDSIVIYGLGCIGKSMISRYQMAFVVLIKKWLMDAHNPCDNCFIFDPIMEEDEKCFIREMFGFRTIDSNEHCKRLVHIETPTVVDAESGAIDGNEADDELEDEEEDVISDCLEVFSDDDADHNATDDAINNVASKSQGKTLFYMPHLDKSLYNNLLWKNWNARHINKLIIIGNSFKEIMDRTPSRILSKEYKYIYHSVHLGVCNETIFHNNFEYSDVFNDISLMTFNLDHLESADAAEDKRTPIRKDGEEYKKRQTMDMFNEVYDKNEPSYTSDTDDVI